MRAGTKSTLLFALALTAAATPRVLRAQGFLEEFSYSGLGLSGLGFDLGPVVSNHLDRAVSGAVRVDYGYIAPRIRTLLSASYFRSQFDSSDIATFEQRLRGVVNDPTNDFQVDVGTITWTNVEFDLDLQYLVGPARRVTPYAGLGVGVQVRRASGAAIDNTFVQDALNTIAADVNASAGVEISLFKDLRLTLEGRGSVASGLTSATARAGLMYRFPHGQGR